jgi:hypothetical protein
LREKVCFDGFVHDVFRRVKNICGQISV